MFDTEMAFYFRKFNILYSHILASKSRMSAKIKYIYKKKQFNVYSIRTILY